MPIDAPTLLHHHELVRSGRREPRPSDALPRRLQAVMQELLTVNERYHESLHRVSVQDRELEALRTQVASLDDALYESRNLVNEQQQKLKVQQESLDATKSAHELSTLRCAAVESESAELRKLVSQYTSRMLEMQEDQRQTAKKIETMQGQLRDQMRNELNEAVLKQRNTHTQQLRRTAAQADEAAKAAFERGKQKSEAELSGVLLREQAERRLLLHRAEEARSQQLQAEAALEQERRGRTAAERLHTDAEQRLRSVRWHKGSLEGQLNAAHAAHAQDLSHFEEMESALGVATAEYATLASKHARAGCSGCACSHGGAASCANDGMAITSAASAWGAEACGAVSSPSATYLSDIVGARPLGEGFGTSGESCRPDEVDSGIGHRGPVAYAGLEAGVAERCGCSARCKKIAEEPSATPGKSLAPRSLERSFVAGAGSNGDGVDGETSRPERLAAPGMSPVDAVRVRVPRPSAG